MPKPRPDGLTILEPVTIRATPEWNARVRHVKRTMGRPYVAVIAVLS